MLKLLLAAVLLLAPAAHAADTFLPNPNECVTASGALMCNTSIGYAIDPGNNAVALYVSFDSGPWQMVACIARDPAIVKNGSLFVDWIQRQHGYRFRGKGQPNCDPAVVSSGTDKHVTGILDRALAFFGAPAGDSPQWAKIYRFTPNGYGGYVYHYLSFCPVWNGKGYTTSTCWSLDVNEGQVFTRRAGETAAYLAGTANGQALSPDTYPTLSAPQYNGVGPLCVLRNSNSYGIAYWRSVFDAARWDNGGAPAFAGWSATTQADATQFDCNGASLGVLLANDARINAQVGRGYATVEQ